MKDDGRYIAAMAEAVAERGEEWVYPRDDKSWNHSNVEGHFLCRYVREGENGPEPACIIGLACHKLGVPLQTLMCYEGASADTMLDELRLYIDLSIGVVGAARAAQIEQDRGNTWGAALEMFNTVLEVT